MSKNLINIIFIYFTLQCFSQIDTTPPTTPVIDSVSVANPNTGSVHVSWLECPENDVKQYIIYRSVNAVWQEIARINAPATYYLDNTAQSNFHPELYRIAAIDTANNSSPMTPINQYHNTIYCFPYFDSTNCNYSIKLSWNPYVNWPEGVKEYKVFCSVNYGNWFLLSVVTNATYYFHTDINNATSYCYYVMAVSNNSRTSTSNITCFFTQFPTLPQYIYIKEATVHSGKIKLSFILDETAQTCNYKLLRSTDNVNFQEIASLNLCGKHTFTVVDNNVIPTQRYFYKLVCVDKCGNYKNESNVASNVVLNVLNNDEFINTLQWNNYYQWANTIDSIFIYCNFFYLPSMLIYSNVYTDTFFVHNIEEVVTQNVYYSNKVCYYIVLKEKSGNIFNVRGESVSNNACVIMNPYIYVPNSFTPNDDNINDVFKPTCTFVSPENYMFIVFDRWGEPIFKTTDPSQGWDGKIKGRRCKEGVYYYMLQYNLPDGNQKTKHGRFFLFYPTY
ncbi:MAG: gliding motility-associated C-terminal domain-containing protein [Bacteroidales bacterium]|nr:gliding motility-associated C-terminal domain-containing protein [Bacteroidales bacterium]